MKKKIESESLKFSSEEVYPGERKRIQIEVASLYDYTKINIPIEVIRGKNPGPTLFISAAIHGDEINGVEIIKRLLQFPMLRKIHGTLICIPVVNVFGFNNRTRYLPDRRDLNRCFPGNSKGSLGSALASIFMKEVVSKCTHGIDLHTGAQHRTNLPQIRASLDNDETRELAANFGVPVVIDSKLRDGSLREAARSKKVCTLLFEGGEALRFEENIINIGLKGCIAVMKNIGMIQNTSTKPKRKLKPVFVAQYTNWVRAPHSGSFRFLRKIGDQVMEGDILAIISDPFGENRFIVEARDSGIIIGLTTIPLVNKGDAMVHVATFNNTSRVKAAIKDFDLEEYSPI